MATGQQYIAISLYVTSDIDITPARSRANLERVSNALRRLDARIRTDAVPEGLPFDHSAESLDRATVWDLQTAAGDLDLTIVPSGTTGYDDLIKGAADVEVLGLIVPIASLADVIRSKEAADREKDRLQLPVLRRLLDESSPA